MVKGRLKQVLITLGVFMSHKTDHFMQEIVLEVIENNLYELEARRLSEDEKDAIVSIYNDIDGNNCPTTSDLSRVWNKFYYEYL